MRDLETLADDTWKHNILRQVKTGKISICLCLCRARFHIDIFERRQCLYISTIECNVKCQRSRPPNPKEVRARRR